MEKRGALTFATDLIQTFPFSHLVATVCQRIKRSHWKPPSPSHGPDTWTGTRSGYYLHPSAPPYTFLYIRICPLRLFAVIFVTTVQ